MNLESSVLGGPPCARPHPPHLRVPSAPPGPAHSARPSRAAELCAQAPGPSAEGVRRLRPPPLAPAPRPDPGAPTFLSGRLRARPTSGGVGSSASTSWGGKSHCAPPKGRSECAPPRGPGAGASPPCGLARVCDWPAGSSQGSAPPPVPGTRCRGPSGSRALPMWGPCP